VYSYSISSSRGDLQVGEVKCLDIGVLESVSETIT